eukprot:TRINITY_DN4978_c0_g2_i1.p1 TRINITY_DN4978_c0_g2~~TRINITY_DN4978_c0_g2_i1.p1  ORF type:complete len:215 (+),score=39.74 TRINITY_DN4978_c0_g2_i1:72-716(+)
MDRVSSAFVRMHSDVDPEKVCNMAFGSAALVDAAASETETCAADETSFHADETCSRWTASESSDDAYSVDAMGAASIDDDIQRQLNKGSSFQNSSVRRDVLANAPASSTTHAKEAAGAQCATTWFVSTFTRAPQMSIRIQNQASGKASRQRPSGIASSWMFTSEGSRLPRTTDYVPCERFHRKKINAKVRRFDITRHPLWVYRDDEFSSDEDSF